MSSENLTVSNRTSLVRRLVRKATELDLNNQSRQAYDQYLVCANELIQIVGEESNNKDLTQIKQGSSIKLLNLMKQCVERATCVLDSWEGDDCQENKTVEDGEGQSQEREDRACDDDHDENNNSAIGMDKSSEQSQQHTDRLQENTSSKSSDSKSSLPQNDNTYSNNSYVFPVRSYSGQDMHNANKQYHINESILKIYRQKLETISNDTSLPPKLKLNKSRQLLANISIIEGKQKQLVNAMKERHDKFQKELTRRVASTAALAIDEEERKKLLLAVCQFEEQNDWTKEVHQKLRTFYNDREIIGQQIGIILSCKEYPLTMLMASYHDAIEAKLQKISELAGSLTSVVNEESITDSEDPDNIDRELQSDARCEVSEISQVNDQEMTTSLYSCTIHSANALELEVNKKLSSAFRDISQYFEKLRLMFLIAWEELNNEHGRLYSSNCLEEPFYDKFLSLLNFILRQINYTRELELAEIIRLYATKPPQELGVSDKFCLQDKLYSKAPYNAAIEELRKLPTFLCPSEKLRCLVRTVRGIFEAVDEYNTPSKSKGKQKRATTNMGCDDLLPILSYVVIKCAYPFIISECGLVEELIDENCLMNEEGYCLTSLQAALGYVTTLPIQSSVNDKP